jgi:hypothetical protein
MLMTTHGKFTDSPFADILPDRFSVHTGAAIVILVLADHMPGHEAKTGP